MGHKTHAPYHHKVSHGVKYKEVMGAATMPLVRGHHVLFWRVEGSKGRELAALVTNILKY